jgi:hypothetical protein
MINWPAVIHYDGDDELVYIDSEEEWLRDAESHLYKHNDADRLIDSSGNVFSFGHAQHDVRSPSATGSRIALEDFIRLVRIHASSSHKCCIEKINFRNMTEGVSLVASMNKNND